MKPLRITIVTGPWYPTPPGEAGAVERIWGDLSRVFARRGHAVTVLSRGGPGLAREDVTDGVRTIRRTTLHQGRSVYLDIGKDLYYSARMLALIPPGDVCVTNAFWLPAMAAAMRRRAGKVYVSIARVPKGQLFLYGRCARIHAVSRAVEEAIVAERPDFAPRTRTIPNPIDLGFFTPPPRGRDFEGRSGAGRTILYTGRIHPEKGLHLLARAFRDLHGRHGDLRLRLIGPSDVAKGGGGEAYLSQLREAAGGAPMTIDPPIYDRGVLADALRAATYYCYPSLAEKGESFGVAPLEAMATGLAPVVSSLPAFREFLVDGRNGVEFNHRASDPAAALGAALQRLIDNPGDCRRMGDRGVVTAAQFGLEEVASRFLDDFRSLVETGR